MNILKKHLKVSLFIYYSLIFNRKKKYEDFKNCQMINIRNNFKVVIFGDVNLVMYSACKNYDFEVLVPGLLHGYQMEWCHKYLIHTE